ncbi:MAG: tetratricopeptide repeat protein [Bacteroidales bacterium]|jgi:tetratricopeptide (TPR) repeat protein
MLKDNYQYNNNETKFLISHFEEMLDKSGNYYFDVEDFEEIIDYYYFKNNNKKAFKAIEAAINQHPCSYVFYLKKAQILFSLKKFRNALEILAESETFDPLNPDVLLTKGAILSQMKKPQAAIKEYIKAIPVSEFPDDIYTNIAFEYENIGDYKKAINYLLLALKENNENDAAIYELAYCYETTGQSENCIKFLNSYLDKNPFSEAAWYNIGIAYNSIELFDKAIDAFDFSIALNEKFISAYYNKAATLVNYGKFKEAIGVYNEISASVKPDCFLLYQIGECYEKMKCYDKALRHYKKAIIKSNLTGDKIPDAWFGISIIMEETGKLKEAAFYIEKAIEINPENGEYWYSYGDLMKKNYDFEKAKEAYKKVTEIEPENIDAWIDYCEILIQQKDKSAIISIKNNKIKHILSVLLQNGSEDL